MAFQLSKEVEQLLASGAGGAAVALDEVIPLVYGEPRFFGGLSPDEAAEALGISAHLSRPQSANGGRPAPGCTVR